MALSFFKVHQREHENAMILENKSFYLRIFLRKLCKLKKEE